MTPTPPDVPPVQTSAPQSAQTLKLVLGTVTALACLAALAFEKKLGADFGDVGRMALLVGVVGPGALAMHGTYKMTPVILLVAALGLSSCATTPPIVISARSITALDVTFVATAAAMDAALDAHHVTPTQYSRWKGFGLRYQASEALAVKLYDAAAAAHDTSTQAQASAVLASFETELGEYVALLLQAVHPDGGS